MDTTGIKDPAGKGAWYIKAEQLTEEQKFELSSVVDELAHWFDARLEEYYQQVNA